MFKVNNKDTRTTLKAVNAVWECLTGFFMRLCFWYYAKFALLFMVDKLYMRKIKVWFDLAFVMNISYFVMNIFHFSRKPDVSSLVF